MAEAPPSEAEFLRALRDRALASVDLLDARPVRGYTPAELEAHSGLSRPSVTGLLKRLKPVLEAQDAEGAPTGHADQTRRWALDPAAGVVIGVEIGGQDHAWVATSDLFGRLAEVRPLNASASADATLDQAVGHIRELLGERPVTDIAGVGMSLASPIERGRALTRTADDSPWVDWQLMSVREHLRARLGWDDVPFRLDNDANLSALAEHVWGASRASRLADRPPYRNVVYLEWSRGIGAGLILEGELYRGDGLAGELGHTVIGDGDERCGRCGHAGCLELAAGWDAVLRRLPEYGEGARLREHDLRAALRRAAELGSDAERAFARAATALGRVVGPAIHLLNPQLVIVGGDVGRLGYDVVKGPLMRSLIEHTLRPALADVTVVGPRLPDYAALRGAIALILRGDRDHPGALLAFLQRKARDPSAAQ